MRRRYHQVETPVAEFRTDALGQTTLGLRLQTQSATLLGSRGSLLQQYAPQLLGRDFLTAGFEGVVGPETNVGVLFLQRLVCGLQQTTASVCTYVLS